MAAREPIEPPRETEVRRTDYTVVEHRSSGGMWAAIIVVLLLIAAGVLYFTGAFNGRALSTETNKVDIKVHTPAAPTNGGGGTQNQ